mmetsp:Transcript_56302/g.159824  ORF Transcript_56302/g.159824 Transcript_56302/m.159824 type:complete len:227 (-) Transcript_56302:948-1628(-)
MSMLLHTSAISTPLTRGTWNFLIFFPAYLAAAFSLSRFVESSGSSAMEEASVLPRVLPARSSDWEQAEEWQPAFSWMRACGMTWRLSRRKSTARMKACELSTLARLVMRSSSMANAASDPTSFDSSASAPSGPTKVSTNLAGVLLQGKVKPSGDLNRTKAPTTPWPWGNCLQATASTWQTSSSPPGFSSLVQARLPRSWCTSRPTPAARLTSACVTSSRAAAGRPA